MTLFGSMVSLVMKCYTLVYYNRDTEVMFCPVISDTEEILLLTFVYMVFTSMTQTLLHPLE